MKERNYSRRQFLTHAGAAAGALLLAPSALQAATKRTAVDQMTLGNTGIKLSRLGFGTGSNNGFIQTELGQEGFNKLIRYAYDQGITYFDCAEAYQTFDWIGDAIKGLPREKLFVQCKVAGNPSKVMETIDRHRKVLKTDYVDTLLVHCMTDKNWTDSHKRLMDGLSEAKEKKWIRARGVSCHSLPALQTAAASDWPEVHLVRVNPQGVFIDGPDGGWGNDAQDINPVVTQLKTMRSKGRGIIGMKIFGNGEFTDLADRQKSIRYAMSRPELDAVVIGFKSKQEIDEAIKLMNEALA